ncbi:uncharacterized protein LOC100835989 [Brachypodium distachyon]|uniref:uncharacterized protein LOC100835989 n=1 Tax=Brachypodium distachyon TaxID=15368 RepID=UPI00052FDE8B|nr:uncharacterized protein LOC100835989 [Brachypodium distachyon]|eukprot:XP_010239928.1 uncharacterized protein LOC100835989 [Brachypodium distachyon]
MVNSARSLLASQAHRRVGALSLEVFDFSTAGCINRLVEKAVDCWGVESLEVVANSTGPLAYPHRVYRFPRGRISRKPGESRLRSLKLGNCLPRSLPKLESLTVLEADVLLCSDAAPCLAHVSFHFSVQSLNYPFTLFLKDAITMRDLVLRLTGPEMWILPTENPFSRMPNLKKLLVADVPSSWDVSWPHILIQEAPLLETLHVHVSQCQEEEPGQNISYLQPSASQQPQHLKSILSKSTHLKELVVIGFQRTKIQLIHLVRFIVDTSTALRRVTLFKHGHVEDKGPCDWEMVSQQSTWSNEEKLAVLDGICCPTDQIEVILG